MIFNILVIICEILYYSLFTKFSKNESKIWKYAIIYFISSIFTLFIGNNVLISYIFIFICFITIGKCIFKIKVKLCDFYLILIMMLFKIIIEGVICVPLLSKIGLELCTFIFELLKILITLILGKISLLNKIYLKILKMWNKNNFYIRYFTIILLMIYIIFTVLCIALN